MLEENKSIDEDGEIQAILKTLAKSDGSIIDDCNHVLNEIVSMTSEDPLYCISLIIFSEGVAY